MRYISVSVMPFKIKNTDYTDEKNRLAQIKILILAAFLLLLSALSYAEVLDRVVAVVNDDIVMFSELNEAFQKAENSGIEVTQGEVLDGLINRILLLRQIKKSNDEHIFSAREMRDDNALINEYIDKRIRAFIRIPVEELELFYKKNEEFFLPQDKSAGAGDNGSFHDVRDDIEAYLIEIELNKRLLEHIEELRKEAYIRIQLERR